VRTLITIIIIIKGGRCVRLTTYQADVPMSRNLGALTFWNPVGLFRPVMGQLFTFEPRAGRKQMFNRRSLILLGNICVMPSNKDEYFLISNFSPFMECCSLSFG
jgi:hypothetical protein